MIDFAFDLCYVIQLNYPLTGCVFPRGMDLLRQNVVQGLRASSHLSAAYFLRQLQVCFVYTSQLESTLFIMFQLILHNV